jgi:hypothetical protein
VGLKCCSGDIHTELIKSVISNCGPTRSQIHRPRSASQPHGEAAKGRSAESGHWLYSN